MVDFDLDHKPFQSLFRGYFHVEILPGRGSADSVGQRFGFGRQVESVVVPYAADVAPAGKRLFAAVTARCRPGLRGDFVCYINGREEVSLHIFGPHGHLRGIFLRNAEKQREIVQVCIPLFDGDAQVALSVLDQLLPTRGAQRG